MRTLVFIWGSRKRRSNWVDILKVILNIFFYYDHLWFYGEFSKNE